MGFALREVLGDLRGEVGVGETCDLVSLEIVEGVSEASHGDSCMGARGGMPLHVYAWLP